MSDAEQPDDELPQEFLASSGKDVWETPDWLVGVITEHVDIDVDPCAGPHTDIGDENYRGPAVDGRDGLREPWYGTVFLNPPFSEKSRWYEACIREYVWGDVERAIVLSPDSTDVKSWWHGFEQPGLANYHDYVWFGAGRVAFRDPTPGGSGGGSPTFGTALHLLGADWPKDLLAALDDHGLLYEPTQERSDQ